MLTVNKLINKTEHIFNQPRIKQICFGLVLVLSFILIYILNVLHPLFGDDWMYSMLSDGHTPVRNFADIIHTQYEHYFTWGGRTVVHIIAQSLLLAGVDVADVINSLAYVALTLVIYFLTNRGNELRPSLLLGINLLIWFFQPAFGSTMLWITGSANYMWGTLIILLFLIPYVNRVYKPQVKDSPVKVVLMFIFGVIAGWTNENMAIGLIFMLFCFAFYYKKKCGKIPIWAMSGLTGAIIGCVIMLAAPGNYVRVGAILQNTEHSMFIMYAGRFLAAISSYYYYVLGATFVFGLIYVLYNTFGRKEQKRVVLFISWLFFAGAIVATLAMSAAPIFPGRASYGINTFVFVAICFLYSNLNFKTPLIRHLSFVVLLFGLLYFAADYNRAYKSLNELSRHNKNRLEKIEQGKQGRQSDFVFNDRITPDSRFIHYFELSHDPHDWHNRTYSAYYKINSIVVE